LRAINKITPIIKIVMKAHWDERYNSEDFAYGENPNVFLTETLPQFKPDKALFAAEGEGLKAIFTLV